MMSASAELKAFLDTVDHAQDRKGERKIMLSAAYVRQHLILQPERMMTRKILATRVACNTTIEVTIQPSIEWVRSGHSLIVAIASIC
jgi:hypothetical protein